PEAPRSPCLSRISARRVRVHDRVSDAVHRPADVGPCPRSQCEPRLADHNTHSSRHFKRRCEQLLVAASDAASAVLCPLYLAENGQRPVDITSVPLEAAYRRSSDPPNGDGTASPLALYIAFGRHHGARFLGDRLAGAEQS